MIDKIESNQSWPKTDVSFSQGIAKQISTLAEQRLEFVESTKKRPNGVFVSVLSPSESSLVDTIVQRLIIGIDHRIDFIDQLARKQWRGPRVILPFQKRMVSIQHSNDLATLIVDDGIVNFVPQHRNRADASEIRIGSEVELLDSGITV